MTPTGPGVPCDPRAGSRRGAGSGSAPPQYDLGMSERKTRLTVTIDPDLAAYAERLVEAGKASSVSAVVNHALDAERRREHRIMERWTEAAGQADPEKVARMRACVDAQLARLPATHRFR